MGNNPIFDLLFPTGLGAASGAVLGWFVCSLIGGFSIDNFWSAIQFAFVGSLLGLWFGYHVVTTTVMPVWMMVGAAIEGGWFIGLKQVSQVLPRGPTAVRDLFSLTPPIVFGDRWTWIDDWRVNAAVGVLGLIILAYGYYQASEQ